MTIARTRVLANVYLDSVMLLGSARAMRESEAVAWATAAMATPANVEALGEQGFSAEGPRVVAYVLGTAGDPQGYDAQREKLAAAGCLVPPTGARAAHVAAAIAARRPALAEIIP